jgi:iron complex transport system ATP-binding protein
MVSINNITFTYNQGTRNILEDISFDIQKNQCIAILGNNGAGKSTLIKCINRICPAQKGVVLIEGNNVYKMTRNVMARIFHM